MTSVEGSASPAAPAEPALSQGAGEAALAAAKQVATGARIHIQRDVQPAQDKGTATHVAGTAAEAVPAATPAAATSTAGAAAAAAEEYSLDDFIASLSLEDQTQVLLPPSSSRQAAAAAATELPQALRFAVQQVLDLLEALVTGSRSGRDAGPDGDAAAAQMLQKLKLLWQQLSGPRAGNVSDPVFVFKDGPVTCAAKLGRPLLLEDVNM